MPWRALVLLCIASVIQSAEHPGYGFGGLLPSEYPYDFGPMYIDCMVVRPVLLTERETKAIYHCYELWYDGAS